MKRLCVALVPAVIMAAAPALQATGGWNTIHLLREHEYAAISSPEFWFELEMKELAKEFPVPEKHVLTARGDEDGSDEATPVPEEEPTDAKPDGGGASEEKDGGEKPADEKTVPAEPSPPADQPGVADSAKEKPAASTVPATPGQKLYEQGAAEYHEDKWDAAREAWTALMALPEAERRDQTVAGEYMLGMTAVRSGALERAPAHFAKTRELAGAGFPDEEALAAASYGWEAFVWKGTDPEKALTLYLKQLSAGDVRAVTSIKYVMRKHYFGGTMEGGEETADPQAGAEIWEKAAASSLLRRIITRWRLAMDLDANTTYGASNSGGEERKPDPWLQLMEKNAPQAEDADRLAWLAYRSASYDEAARWLALATAETRLSLWLSAKLALRNGDVTKASAAMARTVKLFKQVEPLEVSRSEYLPLLPASAAWGDQAVLLMGQAKFTEALTAFLRACCWEDAAYVAEEVMTLAELKAYVNKNYSSPPALEGECPLSLNTLARVIAIPEAKQPPASTMKLSEADIALSKEMSMKYLLINQANGGSIDTSSPAYQNAVAWRLRWLLARRMVRENQQDAARPYFPSEVQPVLDTYLETLKKTQNKKVGAGEKARLWWTAAWIVRHAGMELMGTEGTPDSSWDEGGHPGYGTAHLRFTGTLSEAGSEEADSPKVKFSVPPTAQEKKRIAKRTAAPLQRYHYRWVATALAKKAAALLKNGTEEKADVLNQAGSWLFDRDVKGEEWFFFEIKRTCPETEIGRQVMAKKHTEEEFPGPWSGSAPQTAE